jgi:hypothetical protein
VISEINTARKQADLKAFAELFAKDGDLRVGIETVATGREAVQGVLEANPWTEQSAPIIDRPAVRMLSANVAVVDAWQTQYGEIAFKESTPIMILLTSPRTVRLCRGGPFGVIESLPRSAAVRP